MEGNELKENESIEFNFLMNCVVENHELEIYNETEYYKIYTSPIIYRRSNEDYDIKEQTIGFIEVWYVQGQRAYDNGLDIVEICDNIEQELFEYASSVYKDGYLDDKLIEVPRTNDILILHRIEIDKQFQGRKFGILISRKVIDYLGYNCGAVLIRPYPIQYSDISKKDNWMEKYYSDKFVGTNLACIKKLNSYWKKINKNIIKTNRKDIICIPQF
jgi:hypothetical protein